MKKTQASKLTLFIILFWFCSQTCLNLNSMHNLQETDTSVTDTSATDTSVTDKQFLERIESSIEEKYNDIQDHRKRILFKMIALTAIDTIDFSGIELNKEERKRYHKLKGVFYRKKLKEQWHNLFFINIPNKKQIKQILLDMPNKLSPEQKQEHLRQLINNILLHRVEKLKRSYKDKIRLTINGIDYKKYYQN